VPCSKASLLIVDDAPSIRMLLTQVLTENGYSARSASDGFAAFAEIRREVPEFLISDLNMPGMSGFELLSVVRRSFPQIRVIAMSGSFSGDKVPSGVAADAFFQKGNGFAGLLKIIESLPRPERWDQQPDAAPSPVWFSRYQRNAAGEGYATIECPECLRTFPQVLNGAIQSVSKTDCLYCGSPVRYATFQPGDLAFLLPFQDERFSATPRFARRKNLGSGRIFEKERERGTPILNRTEHSELTLSGSRYGRAQ
jgi:CheY-like chemotaxis protein